MFEQPQQEPGKGNGKQTAKGKKDQEGIEKPIKLKPLKDGVKECMKLYMRAEGARVKYKDAVKATAGSGNVSASTLNKLIKSSAKGNYKEVKGDIEQQLEVFDAVGEVPGGPASEGEE